MLQLKPLIKIMIYVLDDEQDILKWVCIAFEQAEIKNYKVFTSGDTMIEEFNEDVQICVIDYNLNSDKTGVQVMKQIKKLQPLCTYIFLSNMVEENALIDIMNAGCNRFIRKDNPYWLDRLVEHVTEAAIENDERLRRTLTAAARITETIEFFEKLRGNAPNKLQATA
jgi:FixJ family two-component response regulator